MGKAYSIDGCKVCNGDKIILDPERVNLKFLIAFFLQNSKISIIPVKRVAECDCWHLHRDWHALFTRISEESLQFKLSQVQIDFTYSQQCKLSALHG